MSVINKLKVYATAPHSCSYIDGREATTLFLDPALQISAQTYTEISEIGFRRSGKHFYKPHCQHCSDCIPSRIAVNQFKTSRRQRRILNKNSDLTFHNVEHINHDEHYQLYERYISLRHAEGDMYPPSRDQYMQFIGDQTEFSHYTEFRLNNELVAVCVQDTLPNSLSAIYTFFNPESSRSLGAYAILWMIDAAKRNGQQHLYLGYWVRECQKMAYKIEYRPIELLLNGRWQKLL